MNKLRFDANTEQTNALQGLAYWIADNAYIIERYGADDPERQTTAKTIELIFDELDALRVPFWVQNVVICFAEDWRRYKAAYLPAFLKTKKIFL